MTDYKALVTSLLVTCLVVASESLVIYSYPFVNGPIYWLPNLGNEPATTMAPPPPPPRPVIPPAVFFTQAGSVPMGVFNSFICGVFSMPIPQPGTPYWSRDPIAACQRLTPLQQWLNAQTFTPMYPVPPPAPVLDPFFDWSSQDHDDWSHESNHRRPWKRASAVRPLAITTTKKVATTQKVLTTQKTSTTASRYQVATKNMTDILLALRSKLLPSFSQKQIDELRTRLAYLTSDDLELALAVVYDARGSLAVAASKMAQPFFVQDPRSSAEILVENDRKRLLTEVIIAANGLGACPSCQVHVAKAQDIATIVFRNILPPGMSRKQVADALDGMTFLSTANLSRLETVNIYENFVHDMMLSDPNQDLSSYQRSSLGDAVGKRYLYQDKPGFDQDAVCSVLYNHMRSSHYCGVRASASVIYSRLRCADDRTTTTLKPTTTTKPTSTTTKAATTTATPTTATTKPTTLTTQSTASTATTKPTTVTTTAPTTATTTPKTTATSTPTIAPTTTTTTPTTTPTTPTTTPTTTTTTPTTTPTTPTTTTTTPTTTTVTTTTTTTANPSGQCGVSDTATRTAAASNSGLLVTAKIVGGVAAGSCTTYPWMVRILIDGYAVCGGAILDATHILTAAHCANEMTSIQVTVGEYDTTVVEGTEQVFNVSKSTGVALHPNFSFVAQTNDIAVLTLSTPIDMTKICASPVCLDPTFQLVSGQKCQIAGWGVTDASSQTPSDVLQTASISTYQGTDCSAAFPNAGPGYITDPANQVCAGEPSGGVDTCAGDSGGPIFCLNSVTNRWDLVGVTSYGEGCAQPGIPGVYSSVSAYYTWIQQQLSNVA